MWTLGKPFNFSELQCSPVYKMGTFWFTFSSWWGLNAGKCLKPNSSVPDTCMHFPHLLDSLCGPWSILNMQIHSAPVPWRPRQPFSLVCTMSWFQWFSRTFFSPMPARTWLVCEGVAGTLHTAAGAQRRAEGLGKWAMHFSMAGEMNLEQAKLCLFQTLCHKLT